MNNQYINELIDTLEQTKIIVENGRELDYEAGIHALVECFTRHKRAGAQIFFIGNGGSSAIASHMTADFMKNGGMKTYSLYDNAVTTCMGNDYGYEYIFRDRWNFWDGRRPSGGGQQLRKFPEHYQCDKCDKGKKASVITFTGFQQDNKARQLGDINVYVPCEKYGIVESIHNLMLQQVVDVIMERDGVRF